MTTFEQWMTEVDDASLKLVGFSIHDMPDFEYRLAFEDGRDAAGVATEVLEREGLI